MGVKNAAGSKRKAPVGKSGPVGSPKKARLQQDRMDVDGDSDVSDSDMDDFSDDSEDGGVKLTPAPKKRKEGDDKGRNGRPADKGDRAPNREPESNSTRVPPTPRDPSPTHYSSCKLNRRPG